MAPGMIPHSGARAPSTLPAWPNARLFEIRSHRQHRRKEVTNHKVVVPPRRILVLGAGNPLRSDGGVGTRTIETLRAFFEFSDNVTFATEWALCRSLLDALMKADGVVVIDAVSTGGRPGTLHRLTGDHLQRTLNNSNCPHQARLSETLAVADILGRRPETVILAIEPEDASSWSTQLTETIELRIPDLVFSVLAEVERMGGECAPKCAPRQPAFACDLVSA